MLRKWLLHRDDRGFAAVVVRRGYIVLEVERGNGAKTDTRRAASVSKAICATVLAIASEQSQQGRTPKQMRFDDPAFQFIPWMQPLSDPRKAQITVRQLLNHTSGIGGVAFKYQLPVKDLACSVTIVKRFMDVVTTSGPGTG
ncbi:MAG TPA: serine hydrolase domain-containing protein [Phycisphaerae bacterium]|nr:serine hydrolase domain-containing protein [Phycisphaerae bacterium]HRY71532.1 serine hydrolase domain-containing protein [Phycisphaerae bacterium]